MGEAELLTKEDTQGVSQHLAEPSGEEMPEIPRPGALGSESLDQLPQHGFDASSLEHEPEGPGGFLVFARLSGRKELEPLVS